MLQVDFANDQEFQKKKKERNKTKQNKTKQRKEYCTKMFVPCLP